MHGFNALGKKSFLIFQGTTDFERERKRIAMCNCMRNPYGVTMVCGCACGMLSCFRMCDTFQICQCNVDQGIKEDHIQTRLGMGWEASMGVRSTGGILFMNSFFTSMTSR